MALLLNEDEETEETVNQAGYRFFTSVESFKRYVERELCPSEALLPLGER